MPVDVGRAAGSGRPEAGQLTVGAHALCVVEIEDLPQP
jgi:hypothetical protein